LTVREDAQDIFEILGHRERGGYQHTKLLLNGEARPQAIIDELTNLIKKYVADSTLCVYISSHGGRIESGPSADEDLSHINRVKQLMYSLCCLQ
jgi:hypothetical protein